LQIRWSNNASFQLEAAYRFISEDNLSAAEKHLKIIMRAVEQLANFPEMGRIGRVAGTRELVIQGTPYIVAYRLKGNIVTILALLHGARRWPTQL
jgi:toxin ParE1/3/4